jgi:hypothetical protein
LIALFPVDGEGAFSNLFKFMQIKLAQSPVGYNIIEKNC